MKIAQIETVLTMRQKAVDVAVAVPEIAAVLDGKTWKATARFDYEESVYQVSFVDDSGTQLASASVNLNKKKVQQVAVPVSKRHSRRLVSSYKVAG